jgi:hypothetical protein
MKTSLKVSFGPHLLLYTNNECFKSSVPVFEKIEELAKNLYMQKKRKLHAKICLHAA